MRWLRWVVLIGLCFVGLARASAQDELADASGMTKRAKSAAHVGDAIEMYVGFYVNALREVDAHAQTFDADLFYWMRYKRRGDTNEDPDLEELRFMNGEVDSQELEERREVGEYNYVVYRVRSKFHFHADFRRYPFDVQELPIEVQHGYLHASQLRIIADDASYQRSGLPTNLRGLGENLDLMDMYVQRVRHEVGLHTYKTDFGDSLDPVGSTTVSSYKIVIVAGRDVWPFLIKIIVPLLIIQILAYLVFFIAADRIDVASGLTVTSLLASIAFQISLSDSLPDIGYLTTADRIFHLSYFLIMSAMGQMVYAYNLFMQEHVERARKLDLIGRWLYPLVFFVGVGLICWRW